MNSIAAFGKLISARRREQGLRQAELATRAGLSRATIDALENGRAGDIGFSRLIRICTALGLELKVQPAQSARPTLDELLKEDRDDSRLD